MKQIDILKSRVKNSPFILIHLLTSKCNCRCKICDLWKNVDNYKSDLNKEEVFTLLDKASEAGIVYYTIVGGEPLIRDDLLEILKYAKQLKLTTSVITNGFYLKKKCNDIIPFIDVLEVSLDSNDELHDKMRGVDGLLNRAIQGIKLCKNSKTKIIINCVLSKANYKKIFDLIELSKKLDVYISIQPIDLVEGYNDNLILEKKVIQKIYSEIIRYKKSGYKISNSYSYLKLLSQNNKYICHAPKSLIVVKPNGDITSCLNYEYYYDSWGNIKDKKLKEIFNSKSFKNFCKKVEKCNVCNGACIIESSILYSLNPSLIFEKLIK